MTSAWKLAASAGAIALVAATQARADTGYGVTLNQTLVSFDTAAPNAIQTGVAISGLMSNEQVRGIDFRPADNTLYALGSFNNLYTIDAMTGAATMVGSGLGIALNGSSFGFDFNPVIDRIRVVSDAGNNYVLNPDTGTGAQVTSLFFMTGDPNDGATPNVTASAYTNSVAGAASTQLYGIDAGLDILVRQANSAGTLETVGSLGADIVDMVGFDILGATGSAFAVSLENGSTRSVLWSIDLNTGAASMIGEIGAGSILTSFAVTPAPGVVSLAFPAALLAGRRRR